MKLTVYNGSPRGNQSNTKIVMEHFLEGFNSTPGNESQVLMLYKRNQLAEFAETFGKSDIEIIAMPLYVHAMPGLVKHFIEAVKPVDPQKGVKLGFIVQSGFAEGHHSRYLEAYLKRLPARLGCQYLGTAIKGGVEGITIKPGFLTRSLYGSFRRLGEHLGRHGTFDDKMIEEMAKPEWLGRGRKLLNRLLTIVGMADFYWNPKLKKNKVYRKKYDKPYPQ